MHCLENIDTMRIPGDIIRRYLDLYRFIGRNKDMMTIIDDDFSVYVQETIQTDAYYLSHYLSLAVTETRRKRLIKKDIKPHNKQERLLKNIKQALLKVHRETETFDLRARELYDLLLFLYEDVSPASSLTYEQVSDDMPTTLLSSGKKTRREALETLCERYNELKRRDMLEPGFLASSFYVDLANLKPFKAHNETIALFALYILLLSNDYAAFHLSSFFEKIHKRGQDFSQHLIDASHNWREGLSDTIGLHRFLLDIAIEAYKDVHELLRNYTYDRQLNKSDYIENTIYRLKEVFTKDDIRRVHPTVSDSTIDRTLRRLRDEKKIRPLGRGRSAKWMKLVHREEKPIHEQLNLKL